MLDLLAALPLELDQTHARARLGKFVAIDTGRRVLCRRGRLFKVPADGRPAHREALGHCEAVVNREHH